ncbi:hypothetical protein ABVT39_002081 [Epinephelus coioides]
MKLTAVNAAHVLLLSPCCSSAPNQTHMSLTRPDRTHSSVHAAFRVTTIKVCDLVISSSARTECLYYRVLDGELQPVSAGPGSD